MSQVMSISMILVALVAAAGGERWSLTGQGLAFGLILAVCVGQSVMMLVGGARSAVR
jgi:uncharacterized membrane protein